MNEQIITIVVCDLSSIVWTAESEQHLYPFTENYLFYAIYEDAFIDSDKIENQKLFLDVKTKFNIDYIDNEKSRLEIMYDFETLNYINVKLFSADDAVKQAFFKKLQQVIKKNNQTILLTKKTIAAIKTIFICKK